LIAASFIKFSVKNRLKTELIVVGKQDGNIGVALTEPNAVPFVQAQAVFTAQDPGAAKADGKQMIVQREFLCGKQIQFPEPEYLRGCARCQVSKSTPPANSPLKRTDAANTRGLSMNKLRQDRQLPTRNLKNRKR
jgi:hypothetical protein